GSFSPGPKSPSAIFWRSLAASVSASEGGRLKIPGDWVKSFLLTMYVQFCVRVVLKSSEAISGVLRPIEYLAGGGWVTVSGWHLRVVLVSHFDGTVGALRSAHNRASGHQPTAGNVDHLAGYEPCLIGGQEKTGCRHVGWLSKASQRRRQARRLVSLRRRSAHQRRVDPTGRKRVHRDVMIPQLTGKVLGKADQCGFSGGI